MPSAFPPVVADSIESLAGRMGLPEAAVTSTVDEFNRSCRPGRFHPTELDWLATEGIDPPKSNWARPISVPPFYGYELRPGLPSPILVCASAGQPRCSPRVPRSRISGRPAKSWQDPFWVRVIWPVSA